jgi:hypothetical protein
MSLFSKLFGKEKSQPYVDAGTALTFKLSHSLNLPDWNEGLPNYTQEEVAAIDRTFTQFQKLADNQSGGEAYFHPDVIPEIRKKLAGDALFELARSGLMRCKPAFFSNEIPANWKPIVSTFLKAWCSNLSPTVLIELANFLTNVGCKNEAKEVLQVLLQFPTYAKTHWGKRDDDWDKADDELLDSIVSEAKENLQKLS